MTNILISTLLLMQLNTSCKKEKVMEHCTNNGSNPTVLNQDFELVWNVRDDRGFVGYGTVVTPTSVVYFYDPPGPGGDDIVALDKTNGDTLWIKTAQGSTSKHKLVGNKICYSGSGLVSIDANTGVELWRIPANSNNDLNDFIYMNNKIYAFFDLGGGITGDSTKLYEIDPLTGTTSDKFTLYGRDRNGFNQSPLGMVYYKHPNGNEIIFTQSNGYNNSITTSRGEYYAIDMTNDSMYWDLGEYFYDGDINSRGISSSPILYDSKNVFLKNYKYNASINLETKTINWKTPMNSSYRTGGGKMAELNGKIFQSLGNNYNLNIINTNDGSFYKNYNNLGFDNWAPALMKYNNHIYFSSNLGFYKMDGNGTIVKQLLRSEKLSEVVSGTIQTFDIDPATGYIYATIGYNLVCIKEK